MVLSLDVKLRHLELRRFTSFEEATFKFSPGVNVVIGENGTGKSHLLKLIYVLSESVRRFVSGVGLDSERRKLSLEQLLEEMLQAVFQPDELRRLVRRGVGRRKAEITAVWTEKKKEYRLEVALTSLGRLTTKHAKLPELESSVFIPTREVLSIYPGFISSYLKRESSFDRTFYDLCVALDAKPLRGPRDGKRRMLLEPLERALGGHVVNENGKFYLKLPDGEMEAPLVAEGLRKLGMLAYLIVNGSLSANGFLLWDEPEASLNPALTSLTGAIALGLAQSGVQTWVATHDYLLTSDLTLASETDSENDIAFFALARDAPKGGTFVEAGDRLAELKHNSILQAMAALHHREEAAFHRGDSE